MIQLPKVLDSNGQEVRRLHPIRVRLNENIVPLSTASIEVIPEEMVEGRTYVEMFTVNGSVGIYRTRAPQVGYGSAKNTINLEHAICEVGDWLVRANIEQVQKTLDAAIRQIFAYYGGSKWQLGTISPSANVVLSCRYSNLLQTINSLLTQVPGAMLTFDFSTKPWTLNVGSREATVTAEGRLSRNVKSAVVTKDDSQLSTRVWMEGLSGGHMDADTISQYGVIETKLNGSDYTAAQANTIASAYLAKHKRPKYSISINGEDFFAMTGETLDQVRIGKKYRLAVDDQPIEENIVTLAWGDVYGSPYDVTINLSEEPDTVISFIQRQYSDTYGAGGYYEKREEEKEEYRHYKEETVREFTSVYEHIESEDSKLSSRITQNAESITTEVTRATSAENTIDGRVTTVNQELSSRITQTAEAISSEVTRATNAEQTIDGRVTTVNHTLSSRITQNAESITSEVTRATKAEETIDDRVTTETETLSSRITQTAEAISSEVTRAQGAESNLSSRITQNAESISSEVTRATDAEGSLSTRITQNANSISSEVSARQGQFNTLASEISQNAHLISFVVTQSGQTGVINTASIVAAINDSGSEVTISADKINLNGYVKASQFSASGYSTFEHVSGTAVSGNTVWAGNLWVQVGSASGHFVPTTVNIGGTDYTILAVGS